MKDFVIKHLKAIIIFILAAIIAVLIYVDRKKTTEVATEVVNDSLTVQPPVQSYAESGAKVTVRIPKRVLTGEETVLVPNAPVANDDVVIEIETKAEAKTSPTRHDLPPVTIKDATPQEKSRLAPREPASDGLWSVGAGANIDVSGDIGGHVNLGYRHKRLYPVVGLWVDQGLDYGVSVGAEHAIYKTLTVGAYLGSGGKIMAGLTWRID